MNRTQSKSEASPDKKQTQNEMHDIRHLAVTGIHNGNHGFIITMDLHRRGLPPRTPNSTRKDDGKELQQSDTGFLKLNAAGMV